MIFTGVGSRSASNAAVDRAAAFSRELGKAGHTLRTGCDWGASQAFMRGWRQAEGYCECYLPWPTYEIGSWKDPATNLAYFNFIVRHGVTQAALDLAKKFHPAWTRASEAARLMQARNCFILLGPYLNTPVDRVYSITFAGRRTDGVGQMLHMAEEYGIPILDIM
jgi:hypothetical protein